MRGPVTLVGGKYPLLRRLLPLIPYGRAYCEPCGGTAAVLLNRRPSPLEVYNDRNDHLTNLFCVLQRPDQRRALLRRLKYTLHGRTQFRLALAALRAGPSDPVALAWATVTVYGQAFSGAGARATPGWWNTGQSKPCAVAFRSRVRALAAIARRFRHVTVECLDAADCLARYDSPQTVFYVDPPYPLASRAGGAKYYRVEMTDADHDRLLEAVTAAKGAIVVSGYPGTCYDRLAERGWRRVAVETVSHAAGKGHGSPLRGRGAAWRHVPRTELIFLNGRAAAMLAEADGLHRPLLAGLDRP